MIDKDAIEKALLLGVIKNQSWDTLILNGITEEYFSANNKQLYRYIKDYVDREQYPDLRIVSYEFNIDDVSMAEYTSITDLDSLCNTLRKDFIKDKLQFEVGKLNEHAQELETNPEQYIERIGSVYDSVRILNRHIKSVGLFDNIENILQIDPSDVISTGFKELDDKLIGWKRGEELAVFMARTGQGKSWMGLKFAMAAALQGERVGIYSGEMSLQQLQERILCCAKQSYTTTKEEALQYITSQNIDIRVLTQKELRRRANVNDIEEMIIRDRLTMIVIDQLSLMEDVTSRPGTPLRQQYGNISMDLFSLTSKYNLPCILLVQSNRQGSEQRNGPLLENIAESDAVAQNATRVISMKNENGTLTMNLLKNRYGAAGLTQKYDVDFAINKYKPIVEYNQSSVSNLRQSASRDRQMFSGRTQTF